MISTNGAVCTGVSEDISPHKRHLCNISSKGVHVLRDLWDGVASPGFRGAHIFATAFAAILIEHMRADISRQERDYQCKMPERDTKCAAESRSPYAVSKISFRAMKAQ